MRYIHKKSMIINKLTRFFLFLVLLLIFFLTAHNNMAQWNFSDNYYNQIFSDTPGLNSFFNWQYNNSISTFFYSPAILSYYDTYKWSRSFLVNQFNPYNIWSGFDYNSFVNYGLPNNIYTNFGSYQYLVHYSYNMPFIKTLPNTYNIMDPFFSFYSFPIFSDKEEKYGEEISNTEETEGEEVSSTEETGGKVKVEFIAPDKAVFIFAKGLHPASLEIDFESYPKAQAIFSRAYLMSSQP